MRPAFSSSSTEGRGRPSSSAACHQVDERRLGHIVGAAVGPAPIEERRHTVAFGGVDGLRRPEVARKFIVHGVQVAVERPGGLTPFRCGVMRRRIALVVTSRLRAEAGRERFAPFRRREWLRRAYRSYSLLVALGDGPLGDAALFEAARGRWHDIVRLAGRLYAPTVSP